MTTVRLSGIDAVGSQPVTVALSGIDVEGALPTIPDDGIWLAVDGTYRPAVLWINTP